MRPACVLQANQSTSKTSEEDDDEQSDSGAQFIFRAGVASSAREVNLSFLKLAGLASRLAMSRSNSG